MELNLPAYRLRTPQPPSRHQSRRRLNSHKLSARAFRLKPHFLDINSDDASRVEMTSPIIIVLSGGIFVYDTAHVCIYVRHSNDLQLERGLFLQVGLKTF